MSGFSSCPWTFDLVCPADGRFVFYVSEDEIISSRFVVLAYSMLVTYIWWSDLLSFVGKRKVRTDRKWFYLIGSDILVTCLTFINFNMS